MLRMLTLVCLSYGFDACVVAVVGVREDGCVGVVSGFGCIADVVVGVRVVVVCCCCDCCGVALVRYAGIVVVYIITIAVVLFYCCCCLLSA